MSRCVVYQSGGFTNYGINYRKYSQEELAEMENRAMTENEAIEELKYDCNELGKTIPCDTSWGKSFENAYAMAINALEEVQQYRKHGITVESALDNMCDLAAAENLIKEYRAIGTPEECRATVEKQNVNKELESHDEKHILECCISLMQEMVNEFAEWYRWQHGEDAIKELDEEERFCFRESHFRIVQKLFLSGTHHSGGTSTRAKCEQLGVDSSEEIEFDWSDEE